TLIALARVADSYRDPDRRRTTRGLQGQLGGFTPSERRRSGRIERPHRATDDGVTGGHAVAQARVTEAVVRQYVGEVAFFAVQRHVVEDDRVDQEVDVVRRGGRGALHGCARIHVADLLVPRLLVRGATPEHRAPVRVVHHEEGCRGR